MMIAKKSKVETYIPEVLQTKGALLFRVIDPMDYRSVEEAVATAKSACEGGTDAVLVGGSTGAQGELLDNVSKGIKDSIDIPLIIFPGNIATITRYADAIYFMSLLNARNPYWITQAQMLSAPVIRHYGMEPLPIGYIVVAPGGTVGWVGDVNMVPREKPKIAANLALAGQYMGNRFILTDTGSNPQMQNSGPVPLEMIRAVKSTIDIPYIVAGGVSDPDYLRSAYAAGADIVQVGTAFENSKDTLRIVRSFAKIAKEEGAKRLKQ